MEEGLQGTSRIKAFKREMAMYDKSLKAYEVGHEGVVRPASLQDRRFELFAAQCKKAIEENLLLSISSTAQSIQFQKAHLKKNGGRCMLTKYKCTLSDLAHPFIFN